MTTGTGLACMGMWLCTAAMWFSPSVRGWVCLVVTAAAFVFTGYMM